MTKKSEGYHVQLWLPKEMGARLQEIRGRIPYEITVASIGERGFKLVLDEMDALFPKKIELPSSEES